MNPVRVVGGGFSGLATAYYLSTAGIPVEVVEQTGRLGGLIATVQTPHGPVEAAALGLRNTARVDALCRDLGLPMLRSRGGLRQGRYIYRGRPTRWPLTAAESLTLAVRFAFAAARGARQPHAGETVGRWGARVLGHGATRWLVGPALQGMYAGDPAHLSASLVFGTSAPPMPPAAKGVVAPVLGMQQLIDALEQRLRARGVPIHLNTHTTLNGSTPAVICTSARDAADCLRDRAPLASQALSTIDMLPLARVTAFFPEREAQLRGRGMLFPRGQGIRALGVLFDRNIFPGRDGLHCESWIYGGAADRDVVQLSDAALAAAMDRDRQSVCGGSVTPVARVLHRWRAALPHYDLQLESVRARGFDLPADVFLVGNYVGGIGVTMLLEQAGTVAERIGEMV
jgi:oxygen-dependent protoporphyrinogen oxidase